MHLYLLRHGHSEWQAGTTTDRNSNLTDIGIRQAERLANRLRPLLAANPSVKPLSSPLKRALQTATLVGCEPETDRRLEEAEFHVGSRLQFPTSAFDPGPVGECHDDYARFRRDLQAFLSDQIKESSAQPIFVFSHGGAIKTMLRTMIGSDVVDFQISNCSICEALWSGNRWRIISVNETSHLESALLS